MKTLLFITILLFNIQTFALNTEGFQALKDPKQLELAKSLDRGIIEISNEDKQKAKKWAEQVTENVKKHELRKEQAEFIKTIQDRSNAHLSGEFKTKSDALLRNNQASLSSGTGDKANLYVFITLGMKPKNIDSLVKEAKKHGAQVILRGLKNNSFMETAGYLQAIAKEESEGVIIDPTLFRKFSIKIAPTFVLSQEKQLLENNDSGQIYDQVEGNVSIRYALERIASRGDLRGLAIELLK